jgi:hypothetical protein
MQAQSVSTDPVDRMPLTAGENPLVLRIHAVQVSDGDLPSDTVDRPLPRLSSSGE